MIGAKTQDGFPINIPSSFNGYNIIKYLGCGSTCSVFLVEKDNSNEQFSAKIVSKVDIRNRNMENAIINEVSILRRINHPNIIKLENFFDIKNQNDEEYYVIITEYCANGDLLSYAMNHGFQNENEKKKIILDFLRAVEYLHKNGISHGDIKTENILLDSNNIPKLCDFGFCRSCQFAGDESKNGSLYYAAPELFMKGQFDTLKSDIYAIGITLYSLSELQFPFINGNHDFIVQQILNGCFSVRVGMDYRLLKLFYKCIAMNPQCRPTIEEILRDEYFIDDFQYQNINGYFVSNIPYFSIQNKFTDAGVMYYGY